MTTTTDLVTNRGTDATPLRDFDPEFLDQLRVHAAEDDATNSFFGRDLAALIANGHMICPLPRSFGGPGLNLAETARRQRQLGRYAPAVGLATAMHLYWIGAAADLAEFGIDDLSPVLSDAAAGHIIASGHAEAGNDLPGLMSTTSADPTEGGYLITGHKLFGSLGPAWTRLGFHAMDTTVKERPMIVHGFLDRQAPGVEVIANWDTVSMRASQSYDTRLDHVFVPSEQIVAVVPATSTDSLVTGAAFLWAVTLISNVYLGLAERAVELAVDAAKAKTSIGIERGTMAHNPMVQHQVAQMWIALDGARSSVDQLASDWINGVDHGDMWGPKAFATKQRITESVALITTLALDVAGGGSIRAGSELSRLWRDARAAPFHPPTPAFANEAIGKAVLGVDPTGPRW